MRLNRGCGCPVLILLILDLILLAGALIGLIRGPSDEPFQATRLGSGLSALLALGNVGACAILAMGALRGQPLGGSTNEPSSTDEEEQGETTEEDHE